MSRPFLLVISGLPGSGKSSLCAELGRHLPMSTLSSDRIRRVMFRVRRYDPAETDQVYDELVRRAGALLRSGVSVAIDATNMAPPSVPTTNWQELAARECASLLGFHLVVGETALRRRLVRRASRGTSEDSSEATVDTLQKFRGSLCPPFAVELDAEMFTTVQLATIVRPLLDGRLEQATAAEHIATHRRLHDTAIAWDDVDLNDEHEWIRLLGPIHGQLCRDRASHELLGRWGSSHAIDEITMSEILAERVTERLMRTGGIRHSWPEAHAGVLHTYGYLVSPVWTPYGYKRDRWVNGDVAAVLGCPADLLGPDPRQGTLLGNLTTSLDAVLGLRASAAVRPPTHVLLKVEEVRMADGAVLPEPFELRTYLAHGGDPELPEPILLIYTALRGDVESYVTAFTVTEEFAEGLLTEDGSDGTIRVRYNASNPFGNAHLAGHIHISTWQR